MEPRHVKLGELSYFPSCWHTDMSMLSLNAPPRQSGWGYFTPSWASKSPYGSSFDGLASLAISMLRRHTCDRLHYHFQISLSLSSLSFPHSPRLVVSAQHTQYKCPTAPEICDVFNPFQDSKERRAFNCRNQRRLMLDSRRKAKCREKQLLPWKD